MNKKLQEENKWILPPILQKRIIRYNGHHYIRCKWVVTYVDSEREKAYKAGQEAEAIAHQKEDLKGYESGRTDLIAELVKEVGDMKHTVPNEVRDFNAKQDAWIFALDRAIEIIESKK